MNLEQQVCSLDLAKRLKELGVKQESLYYWRDSDGGLRADCIGCAQYPAPNDYAAFTVAELGEWLILWDSHCGVIWKAVGDEDPRWYGEHEHRKVVSARTEADARAKMLIYLLENKLVTV